MKFKHVHLKSALLIAAVAAAAQVSAAPIGYGRATTGGGSKTPVTVSTMAAMQAAIDAYSGTGGLVLNYTGRFNFASITDPCAQHSKSSQKVQIKDKGSITIMGANGSSANFGIRVISASPNIIIRNMTIGLLPGGSDSDAIAIEGDSSGAPVNIWIDHNTLFSSMADCAGAGDSSFDGLLDTKKGADNITVSYNYFHDHHKVSLNGFSDSDNTSRHITFHHNRYDNVGSRTPLQRFGSTHIFNNYFNKITTSGINVRMGGVALIESNYFENVENPVTSRDSSAIGFWDLRNNFVGSGITWSDPGSPGANATNWATTKAFGSTGYSYTATAASGVKAKVIATAGAGTNLAE